MYLSLLGRNGEIVDKGAFEYLAWRRGNTDIPDTYVFVRCHNPEDADTFEVSVSLNENVDTPVTQLLSMQGVWVAQILRHFSRYAIPATLDLVEDSSTTIITYKGEFFLPSPRELRERDDLVGDWPQWQNRMVQLLNHTGTGLVWPRLNYLPRGLMG